MRFILNFFFFGLLFYLIYLFFPDAFQTLVSWANQAYSYIRDVFLNLSGRVHPSNAPNQPPHQQALLLPLLLFISAFKSAK